MTPTSPVIPEAAHLEVRLGETQPEYQPLPALPIQFGNGASGVVTRWCFSDEERKRIADGGDLFVTVLTFGQKLQPLLLGVDPPEIAV